MPRNDSGFMCDDTLDGVASLVYEIDKKIVVYLRDGRILVGYLRSIDQYLNLVLQNTMERFFVGKRYGEMQRGLIIIRGENVSFMGEFDLQAEEDSNLTQVPLEVILEEQRLQNETNAKKRKEMEAAMERFGLSSLVDDTNTFLFS